MPLSPDATELRARAVADLRVGLPVAVGGTLFAAVETVSPARVDAMRALGPVDVAVTARRAATLRMRAYDGDLARVGLPEGAEPGWLRAVADPARDLAHPMKGPFDARRGGDARPWRVALGLAKAAQLLPAVVGVAAAPPPGVTVLPVDGVAAHGVVADVAAARLPTALAGAGRLHVFRDDATGLEHMAFEVGQVDRAAPVLVRLHSACFTGDVLGSLKCDCGPQLHAALSAMRGPGGLLLYLMQEGRGIGLANKMRAYALQDQGFDTVEANHRLGFEDDERNFDLGAALLKRLDVGTVRLMTNNPRKLRWMVDRGIEVVERVPLHAGRGAQNAGYLDVKRSKSGHLE
ncbi:GTP cyclohydrolase II [Jannaschia sp. LMIT008]|uniref:GTP cyclohydrolase II n=1 Tax=Jannaschia maritima TaxID=3032585 RepID=UPI002811AD14|nr:GTP cyclohydrolase II [Jannaschia sp. LMIT008]